MTSPENPYPVVSGLIDLIGDWVTYRRDLQEIREMEQSDGGGEFARIAHDLGVTPADLRSFVRQGPHSAEELPKLLKSLGIDEKAMARAQPRVLSDMQRVCSSCESKRRCHHEIAAGTAAEHYEEYCGNAGTVDALRQ